MSLKQQLILKRERWSVRFAKRWQAIQLPIAKKTLTQILICLPEENSYSPIDLIADYQNLFADSRLLFCAAHHLAERISSSTNCFYYKLEELPLWRKLTIPLTELLAARQFEMAVDLNTTLSLPAALICMTTKAPLRISFAKPDADLFYNVQVQIQDKGQSMQNKLATFRKHLQPLINCRKQSEPIL